ncbi:MAG: urea ABC transporter ATP-binding protein UrtD [Methylovirgula sp.]
MGVLNLNHISKNFGGTQVINDFSLDVTEGTLCCLVGPNGAGKTTTMDLITGRQKPSSGQIIFRSEDITGLGEHEIARRGIGRKFQVPAVFKELTVLDNFTVAYSRETNPFRNMFRRAPPHFKDRLDEVLSLTGLGPRRDTEAGIISHGETQWLEIGMLLMQDPAILLLDEPVAGMTEGEIEKTVSILNRLKKTNTLVVVEHDMEFVRKIADVVTVMHMGSLLARGTIAEVEVDPRVRDVYLGDPEE